MIDMTFLKSAPCAKLWPRVECWPAKATEWEMDVLSDVSTGGTDISWTGKGDSWQSSVVI